MAVNLTYRFRARCRVAGAPAARAGPTAETHAPAPAFRAARAAKGDLRCFLR